MRMLNLTSRDQKTYSVVHMNCHVRSCPRAKETVYYGNNLVIVGVGRLTSRQPISELTIQETCLTEFTSQHRLDGKIIFSDQRQALISGRLPHEVCGKSPYDFIHPEDLPVVQFSHVRVMNDGNVDGTVFRMFTEEGQTIYIQSRSTICFDNWTKEPKFILSNNVLISASEFSVLMSRQKKMMMLALADGHDGSEEQFVIKLISSSEKPEDSLETLEYDLTTNSQTSSPTLKSRPGNLKQSPIITESGLSSDDYLVSEGRVFDEDGEAILYSTKDPNAVSVQGKPSCNSSPGHSGERKLSSQDTEKGDSKESSILANLLYGQSSSAENTFKSVFHQCITQFSKKQEDNKPSASVEEPSLKSETFPTGKLRGCREREPSSPLLQAFDRFLDEDVANPIDARTAAIQGHLSLQLQEKYRLLEKNIERQEAELCSLREHMIKYLLTHPDEQEAYLNRLQLLESKRKDHEETLKSLQELHDIQRQKTLLQINPSTIGTSGSHGVVSQSSKTPSVDQTKSSDHSGEKFEEVLFCPSRPYQPDSASGVKDTDSPCCLSGSFVSLGPQSSKEISSELHNLVAARSLKSPVYDEVYVAKECSQSCIISPGMPSFCDIQPLENRPWSHHFIPESNQDFEINDSETNSGLKPNHSTDNTTTTSESILGDMTSKDPPISSWDVTTID